MSYKARVSCKVYLRGSHQEITTTTAVMSTDLPQDNIGEVVTQAINEAWKQGYDPVNFDVVVSFG